MIWVPILISVLALLITGANFYFTHLRKKRALHVAVLRETGRDMIPGFAIINAGSEDIIITSMFYLFKKDNNMFHPHQTREQKGSESLHLSKGKGIHVKISFPERFSTNYVKTGVPDQDLYDHELFLRVSWIQSDGKLHTASVLVAVVGMNLEGEIRRMSWRCETDDLYRKLVANPHHA